MYTRIYNNVEWLPIPVCTISSEQMKIELINLLCDFKSYAKWIAIDLSPYVMKCISFMVPLTKILIVIIVIVNHKDFHKALSVWRMINDFHSHSVDSLFACMFTPFKVNLKNI